MDRLIPNLIAAVIMAAIMFGLDFFIFQYATKSPMRMMGGAGFASAVFYFALAFAIAHFLGREKR